VGVSLKVTRGSALVTFRTAMSKLEARHLHGARLVESVFNNEEGSGEGVQRSAWEEVWRGMLDGPAVTPWPPDAGDAAEWRALNPDATAAELEMLGVAVGLTLTSSLTAQPAHALVPWLWRELVGEEPLLEDIELADPLWAQGFTGPSGLLHIPVADVGVDLTMTRDATPRKGPSDSGGASGFPPPVPLVDGGEHVVVTDETKGEYYHLLALHRMRHVRGEPGLERVVPGLGVFARRRAALGWEGASVPLREAVCGTAELCPEQWEAAAELGEGTGASDVAPFWAAVRELDAGTLRALLRFWHGSSGLPPSGLAGVQPKFQVRVTRERGRRLAASTCFNQLTVPQWKDKEDARAGIDEALANGDRYLLN